MNASSHPPTRRATSDGNSIAGGKGVLITPEYVLIVRILHPAKGVDPMNEARPTVQAVADNLAQLG